MNKRELNGKSPNRHGKYVNDTRYEKVWEQMQLLGIKDITTERQYKNGTIVWRLPIKNEWPGNQKNATFIEVASFKTGYVRNQNSGYSNYQLNKRCEGEPQYYDSGKRNSMGKPLYTKFSTRSCILIPIEIDRLEYLISYCLKNYYIKRANQVVDGEYIPKWKNEADKSEQYAKGFGYANEKPEVEVMINGFRYKI
jgi:hypothetical protein